MAAYISPPRAHGPLGHGMAGTPDTGAVARVAAGAAGAGAAQSAAPAPAGPRLAATGAAVGAPSDDDCVLGRFDLLAAALASVEQRSRMLAERLAAAEAQRADQDELLDAAHDTIFELQAEQAAARQREQLMQHEVTRLGALLEAEKLQSAFAHERLAGAATEEQRRRERAERAQRDAMQQRDEALLELQSAYGDIDALQATLADSAGYVRQLRRRLLELELRSESAAASARAAAAVAAAAAGRDQGDGQGAFSVAAVRAAITAEVREAAACDPEERRKRIRALQLRWHPDKNPAPLRELSTEVTKIINHALEEVEGTSGGGGAAAGAAWRGDAWRSGGASHQQAGGWRD